jgi:ElaB/YqjD/DUF883 family membrane-anchored ribosome-binding protein
LEDKLLKSTNDKEHLQAELEKLTHNHNELVAHQAENEKKLAEHKKANMSKAEKELRESFTKTHKQRTSPKRYEHEYLSDYN